MASNSIRNYAVWYHSCECLPQTCSLMPLFRDHALCNMTMPVFWGIALPVSYGRCAEAMKLLRRLSTLTLSLWVGPSQSCAAHLSVLSSAEEPKITHGVIKSCLGC